MSPGNQGVFRVPERGDFSRKSGIFTAHENGAILGMRREYMRFYK